MIIIGHKAIKHPIFKNIKNIEDINNTNANEIVYFESDYKIANYCKDNEIKYAVKISNITDLIIYSNLDAKYILVREKNIAENSQKIANDYFFDSKILYIINDESSIENAAMLGFDGVIFESVLN
ncbi:hypothetical protein [Helicobacter sp. MIT 14-3879]|uniref:hypothetical protein n=1 Tax=Helicobacter sp. MIT 14-3879 TaxID=2040649 RepID=UPI000E1F74F0|nr:hypothetical protein [Helicobacter sp. MIT 14-3879]RDU62856.1 hypothetical protein CQA44_06055 [Helicobacter sp. MIT 14-3879]